MGWLNVLLSAFASVLLYDTGHAVLLVLAIGATIGCFWSWGIMHNFATEAAKQRLSKSLHSSETGMGKMLTHELAAQEIDRLLPPNNVDRGKCDVCRGRK